MSTPGPGALSPHPTWYDVLGVSRDATPEEIKAAWRTATDRFEPGSGAGQFRMFSEAADVLLDPQRRAAYDAQLDAPEDTRAEPATVAPPPPDLVPRKREPETTTQATPQPEPEAEQSLEPEPDKPRKPRKQWPAAVLPRRSGDEPASGRVMAIAGVLALLTVVAIVLAVIFGLQVREDAAVADAREAAPPAAERAAEAVLSYDYRELDANEARAKDFLTSEYAKEFAKTIELLKENKDGSPGPAVQTKTVVKATALASGIVDADADTVRVLLYVNQVSEKAGADPQIFQNRVSMTMTKDGERWLVDEVKSY